MRYRYLVSYVGKLWKGLTFVGQLTMVRAGFIVKNLNTFHPQYQPRNKKEY
jgi:hypothetical protein